MKKEIILRTSKGEVFVEMEDRTMKSYIDLDDNDLKTLVEGGSDSGSGDGGEGGASAESLTLVLSEDFSPEYDGTVHSVTLEELGITDEQISDAINGKYMRIYWDGTMWMIVCANGFINPEEGDGFGFSYGTVEINITRRIDSYQGAVYVSYLYSAVDSSA